jgi:small subunit ribosomal protein S24e
MEIDIQIKTNNPLLKRTEVHFTLIHNGESTPKRELVRSELADKLKVKKENIMINYMKANFGKTETIGYARIYKSVDEAKSRERDYILKRNKVIAAEKKKPKEEPPKQPPVKPDEAEQKPIEEKTDVPPEEKEIEKKPEEEIEEPTGKKEEIEQPPKKKE